MMNQADRMLIGRPGDARTSSESQMERHTRQLKPFKLVGEYKALTSKNPWIHSDYDLTAEYPTIRSNYKDKY
ncbi:hypothetical protein AMECASPLE_019864 [Ameca splendens]|uniref:Uncharacterized protein n=1 Tax=Ameca splendens TaxID=208324 RepID=A0ABV0YE80_9TELE